MRYRNNIRILIFGHPGEGKTTLSVKLMKKALMRGEYVYSNIKINWFGDLYRIPPYKKLINFVLKFILSFFIPLFRLKLKNLSRNVDDLTKLAESNEMVDDMPTVDLQLIFVRKFLAYQTKDKLERLIEIYEKGLYNSHWYDPHRYQFIEDLEEATKEIIIHSKNNPDAYHGLFWDEGFIDLDYSNGVPAHITNFFNQSRKLNVDIIVSSQRPVAVYPAFRALCNYMLQVVKPIKILSFFYAKQYFVDDDPNALPDITTGMDGKSKAKIKYFWRGKYIFPYFASRQSIALTKLITKSIK